MSALNRCKQPWQGVCNAAGTQSTTASRWHTAKADSSVPSSLETGRLRMTMKRDLKLAGPYIRLIQLLVVMDGAGLQAARLAKSAKLEWPHMPRLAILLVFGA
mmetsp:Transcript_54245/g.96212  ORF Transcript_54245/g.96212 Transcript_54245/m.96212 type:complete len:103 (+) Transcript_54245:136-444(+)